MATRQNIMRAVGAIAFIGVGVLVALALRGPTTQEVQSAANQVEQQQAIRTAQSVQTRKELHDALVWSCRYLYGNLQRVMHARIMREIRSSAQVKQSYFNIPPATYRRLIRASIQAKRRELKRVAPVNCHAFWSFLLR